MEFLDINLKKESSLVLHAIHITSTVRIYRKPLSTQVLKIRKKIRETRKLESIHKKHFIERKKQGMKVRKNLSLRSLCPENSINAVLKFTLCTPNQFSLQTVLEKHRNKKNCIYNSFVRRLHRLKKASFKIQSRKID